tara:strand:+ start:4712 stop:6514 length:1803 start_codon:yes stop_codon:yes gene_type:complete
MADFDKEILKKIEIQQKFADFIYKDFRSKRFGLSPCCSIDELNKYAIKSELCNQPEKIKTYSEITYAKELWNVNSGEDPNWLEGQCQNPCTYPATFTPNAQQLANTGGHYYNSTGGINVGLKCDVNAFENIPNVSGNAQITFYAVINAVGFNAACESIYGTDEWTNILFPNGPENGYGNVPPFQPNIPQPYPVAIAQCNIRPNANGINLPVFYYEDPIASVFGDITWTQTTDSEGNQMWGYVDDSVDETGSAFGFTFFGNTVTDYTAWTTYNGGQWYPDNWDFPIIMVVKDGGNTYTKVLYDEFPEGFPDPTYYYASPNSVGASVAGDYESEFNSFIPMPPLSEPIVTCTWSFPNGGVVYENVLTTFSTNTDLADINPNLSENVVPQVVSVTPCYYCGFEKSEIPWSPWPELDWDQFMFFLTNGLLPYQDTLPPGYQEILSYGNILTLCDLCDAVNQNDPNGFLNTQINLYTDLYPLFEGTGAQLCAGCVEPPFPSFNAECIDDAECIRIEVTNQNGDPVEGYEIILNGGNAGFTDKFGLFKTTIKNASVNNEHTLNVCYCFKTTGGCSQQKIKIVLTDDEIKECNIEKAACTEIEEAEE